MQARISRRIANETYNRLYKQAHADLVNITLFIAQDNIDRALSFKDEVKQDIERLGDNPLLGVVPQKYTIYDKEIRAYIMGNYVALYKFTNDTIEIRRIVNAAMLHGIIKA